MKSAQQTINQGVMNHTLKGQQFSLLPDKALMWLETETLILSDLHLGKATHFRKAGIAVPAEVEKANLDRLAQLLLDYSPRRVLILGDLFHSHYNAQWKVFLGFLSKFEQTQFVLVMGNHDILDAENYKDITNLMVYDEALKEGPFLFTHEPLERSSDDSTLYNICGHIHPGVVLRGAGLQSLKLPCFHFMSSQMILPAFGEFTGTHRIEPKKADVVYALSGREVIRVL